MGQSADGRRRISVDPLAVEDSDCHILHVDMDAFFAAVELRRRPELRGMPMMVAGDSGRGVVLSASYEARRYGIRSAMPTAAARARCPGIVVITPDQAAYHRVSEQVMQMFRDVTPMVEPLSVDEAFLDVSGARRALGRPVQIATRLRERIVGELSLTATIGRPAPSSSRSWRPDWRNRTACWPFRRPRSPRCWTRCRSAPCGASGRRPRRCCRTWD